MNKNVTVPPAAMQIDWDVGIAMDDGLVVRADIFRPVGEGQYPVLLSYGPYGKGLHFEDGYKTAWDIMARDFPDTVANTSNAYQNWEVVDPEKWVPHGYVCMRVDSRGCGRTPGVIDHHSPRETRDFYQCIEWAAAQPWSNGKVGLAGISYYAANQWRVAAQQPPHLAAICAWEGYADRYRDSSHHGGIVSTFQKNWQAMQVMTVQHGVGTRGKTSRITGELVCGPETLSEAELANNVMPLWGELIGREFDDDYYKVRSADWSQGRGAATVLRQLGRRRAASARQRRGLRARRLEAEVARDPRRHPLGGVLYRLCQRPAEALLRSLPQGRGQRLGQAAAGDAECPPSRREIRPPRRGRMAAGAHAVDEVVPAAGWQELVAERRHAPMRTVSFEALGDGLTFFDRALCRGDRDHRPAGGEVVGVVLDRGCRPVPGVAACSIRHGKEVTFQGALDPHAPVAQGWLRASHRKLDPALSLPYRPYHSHDEKQPLTPGVPVELDIEIWPTCIVVPKGYRVALTVRGKDYEWDGPAGTLSNMKNPMRGCGPFVHDDPVDRPAAMFGGTTTLHFAEGRQPYVLVPVIPGEVTRQACRERPRLEASS